MKVIPYFTFKNGEDLVICQRNAPHYIGVISDRKESTFHTVQIPLHNLYISFKGVLEGNFVLMREHVVGEIEKVFEEMALHYWEQVIQKNPKRFDKYKI